MARIHELRERPADKRYRCPGCGELVAIGEPVVGLAMGLLTRYAHPGCGAGIMARRARENAAAAARAAQDPTGQAGRAANGRVIRHPRGLGG